MSNNSKNILIFGGYPEEQALLTDIISVSVDHKVKIDKVLSKEGFYKKIKNKEYELIVYDIFTNDVKKSIELVKEIKEIYPDNKKNILFIFDSPEIVPDNSEFLDSYNYIVKPFSLDEFNDIINRILF